MFPRIIDKLIIWYMPKVLEFLDRNQLSELRKNGQTLDTVLRRCEELTGDRNFMYLASLYSNKNMLKVYTVHAINARRLEDDDIFHRIDEVEQFWQPLGE